MNILEELRKRGLLKYMNIESMKQMIMQKEDLILSIMEEIDTLEQIVQEMESPCEKNDN